MSVPQLSSRDVQRYLDRGMDYQSAVKAALQDSRERSTGGGIPPLELKMIAKEIIGDVHADVVVVPIVNDGPGMKPRRRSRDLEHTEQRQLFKHIRAFEEEIPILRFVHAVPNGGKRSKATAGKLWAEGVRGGPPDVYLDVANQGFHGFRLELKAPGNEARTSEDQRDWHKALRRAGYFVTVEDTWESAWNTLVWYLGLDNRYLQPMRGDE